MRDLAGKEIEPGDVVVSGQRRGSGGGFLVVREVVAVDGDSQITLRGRDTRKYSMNGDSLLVVPREHVALVGRSRY